MRVGLALASVALVTATYAGWLHVSNATIVALTFLLVVLIVAATSRLWIAVATSMAAMACFNFFFLPPVGTLTIADPQNWVVLFAFLAVALVASNLSSSARARATEALARRDDMARLFDLSRDVLLVTDTREAIALLAELIARRFDLEYAAICLPRGPGWDIHQAGSLSATLDPRELARAIPAASGTPALDTPGRTAAGHHTIGVAGTAVRLVPLRLGHKPVGLMACAGRAVEPGTLDALGGVAAIAIERVQFLEERKQAELSRQSEQLKTALLASLGHDLRTPLTAIRVAAANLQASWLTEAQRSDQAEVVLTEVERLTRLFHNILEMAQIDAGAVGATRLWVHPSQIIEAARDQVIRTLAGHRLRIDADPGHVVGVDPRLTAAALAHVLENAAQYAPAGTEISVSASVDDEGLVVAVRDRGPGISAPDLQRIFDRFFRGTQAKTRASGTGMGLAIARGLLAAEQGRIWAENCADGGARFTIQVPATVKATPPAEPTL